jgi:hypothetical protein
MKKMEPTRGVHHEPTMSRTSTLLVSTGVQDAPFGRGEGVGQHRAPHERNELRAQVAPGSKGLAEENLRLRQELLVLRDDLIGHEARLGEALGRIELLEADLARYRDAVADAERLLGSRTGRLLRAWHRLRALLRA